MLGEGDTIDGLEISMGKCKYVNTYNLNKTAMCAFYMCSLVTI